MQLNRYLDLCKPKIVLLLTLTALVGMMLSTNFYNDVISGLASLLGFAFFQHILRFLIIDYRELLFLLVLSLFFFLIGLIFLVISFYRKLFNVDSFVSFFNTTSILLPVVIIVLYFNVLYSLQSSDILV